MRDPVLTYTRMINDLERIAAATATKPLDPGLVCEIKELKEELANHGYVYLDGYERPFRLVPAIRKCYKCGKIITTTTTTKECKHKA